MKKRYIKKRRKWAMSLFSVIGIILFVVVALIGISLKIFLRQRRKDLDGFHGYVKMKYTQEGYEDEEVDWKDV